MGESATNANILRLATGDSTNIGDDWMPASQVRAFIFEDPILVWLEHHGEDNGFEKDTNPYDFADFIFEKGNQFERKWIEEMAPEAIQVCDHPWEARHSEKVEQTWELMRAGTPVISQGALWWAPGKIYGVPDLMVRSSWLLERFPESISPDVALNTASNLGWHDGDGHYVVIDIKFTTKLDSSDKATSLRSYGAQVRIYTYILGSIQGYMPERCFLVQRKPVDSLLPVEIQSTIGASLDSDLLEMRNRYAAIKLSESSWQPWNSVDMQPNMTNREDAPWHSAKSRISEEYVPGCELTSIHYVGPGLKEHLVSRGYPSRDKLVTASLSVSELQTLPRIGATIAPRIAIILEANRLRELCPRKPTFVPSRPTHEYFVDFEFFTNVNVNFDEQWPTLDGCEMIFVIGVGWEDDTGSWKFEKFIAETESSESEERVLREFVEFLQKETGDDMERPSAVYLHHWSNAEASQMKRAADRHDRSPDDLWRRLPWYDLQKEVFYKEPIGIPGAWDYELKSVGQALNNYDPSVNLTWPATLQEGLIAMVMGWKAYEQPNPTESQEMQAIIDYNEVDCKAMWSIVTWLRSRDA